MSFYGRGSAAAIDAGAGSTATSTGPTLLVPGSGWTPQGQVGVKVAVQPRLVVDTYPVPDEKVRLVTPTPDSQALEVSWMDQELVTGVKNLYLVIGGAVLILGGGFFLMRKKSSVAGYRRRRRR